jgi:hypothetical protein
VHDTSLLDRILTWLDQAREKAHRTWKWQTDEAIIVSTHSTRAWRCTVQPIKDGTEERIEVVEISRQTGEPYQPEPESYQWKPTIFTTIDEPVVPFQEPQHRDYRSENWGGDAP